MLHLFKTLENEVDKFATSEVRLMMIFLKEQLEKLTNVQTIYQAPKENIRRQTARRAFTLQEADYCLRQKACDRYILFLDPQ